MTTLFPYQLRTFWRGVKAGDALVALNLLLLGIGVVTYAPRWIEACCRAAAEMRSADSALGPASTEKALVPILLAWIVLSGFVRDMHVAHPGLSAAKLLRFPLSRAELFAAAVLGSFAHPAVVVLLVLTWFVMLPLTAGAAPAVGAAAGVLFVLACIPLSWVTSLVVTAMFGTRAGRLAGAGLVFAVLAVRMDDSGATARAAAALWKTVRPVLPPALAARAASEGSVAAVAGLGAWLAALLVAAPALLGFTLGRPPGTGKRSRKTNPLVGLPGVPGPIGSAAAKEVRYLCRTADAFVAAAIGLLGALYVFVGGEPMPVLLPMIAVLVVLTQAGASLNAFGLDRTGIDRYRLLPLSGRDVLLSKNLAFGVLAVLQLSPLVVVAGLRFGALAAAALLFGATAYVLAAVLVGNFASSRSAAPREFHGIESIEQSGGLIPVLVLLAASVPPAALAGVAAAHGGFALAGGQLALLGLLAAAYAPTLRRAGCSLEARFDELREGVAG